VSAAVDAADDGTDARNKKTASRRLFELMALSWKVELRGFEPRTSCMPVIRIQPIKGCSHMRPDQPLHSIPRRSHQKRQAPGGATDEARTSPLPDP
jgi:hypothetical protein